MVLGVHLVAFVFLLSQASLVYALYVSMSFSASGYDSVAKSYGFQGGSVNLKNNAAIVNNPIEYMTFTNDGQDLWLETDISSLLTSASEYSAAFWVMFESTISPQVFSFGDPAGNHYIVSSTQNGKLDVVYYKDSTTTDPNNNISINVPLSNFYLEKWFFIVFDFISGSPATLKIAMTNAAVVTKTSDATSTAPLQKPNGAMTFGKSVVGKFMNFNVAKSFTQADLYAIKLVDVSGSSVQYSAKCTVDCYDDACYSASMCLSSYLLCTFTGSFATCSKCPDGSGRDKNSQCMNCLTGYSFKDHHCNIYLGCLDSNNCESCSTSSTICDTCNSTSFFYDVDATNTMCLCNLYVACDNSCTTCSPSPNCYKCASSVVQSANTCGVEKVGYQLSLENSNIIIDFAHPLSAALTKSAFKATASDTTTDIATTGWTLSGCIAGSKKCTIITDNVTVDDLPIDLEIQFSKV